MRERALSVIAAHEHTRIVDHETEVFGALGAVEAPGPQSYPARWRRRTIPGRVWRLGTTVTCCGARREASMPDTRIGAALLEAARAFRPRIIADRDRLEAARRIPEDLAQELARAGFFRLLLPEAYGGLDLTPMVAMEVFEELAGADASVAWCVWNGNTHWTAAQLSPEAARTIHADPDAITANSTRA